MLPADHPSVGLFTDLYELTMAQAYWQSGTTAPATFSLFFRDFPPNRAYFVCAGLADVLDYLESFRFTPADVAYLRSLDQFDPQFLAYLSQLRFTGTVRAMTEGTIFFAHEPVLEVTAPVIEAQLVETFILNQVNLQTILATKASRVVHAARGRTLVDFAARRAHGLDAANKLVRVSYMVGFDGTSNTMAGALYGIPVFGTMAHSFVTCFPNEIDSFRAYAGSFPDGSTLLVDTYDTLAGTRKALMVAKEMRQQGHELRAIRLDSGDLLALSRQTRSLMDEAGFPNVRIFASGGLDEFEVDDLLSRSAPIDGFGVGTKVGVSADAPYTDCAYKLVAYDSRPVLKLSERKQTLPDPKQVFRWCNSTGQYQRDMIGCRDESHVDGRPLLADVMRNGRRDTVLPTLEELRRRFQEQFAALADRHKSLRCPEPYSVSISRELQDLQELVTREAVAREITRTFPI